ncbi:hypothetical protein MMC28_008432 [Mycoblastus sanguinarius]|nr:hypothetical protein [Mycoblastus sanguinarius]
MDLVAGVRKEGSRGGRGDFSWSDVKDSQHRENYLGHSLMAPVGRWQKNKDLSWYAKSDTSPDALAAAEARKEEIRRIKEAEQDALSEALGYGPIPKRNPNEVAIGQREVEKAIKETADGDEEDGAKGVGFGGFTGVGVGKEEGREVLAGEGVGVGMRERRKGRDEAGAEMAIGNEGIGGSMTVKAGHIDDTGQRTGQCRDGPIEESVQEVSRGGGMIIGVAKSGQGATRGGRIMTEAEESDQTITRGGEMLMGTEGSGNEAIRRLSLNEEDNSRGGKRLQKIKGDSKLQNLTPLRVPSLDLLAREDI